MTFWGEVVQGPGHHLRFSHLQMSLAAPSQRGWRLKHRDQHFLSNRDAPHTRPQQEAQFRNHGGTSSITACWESLGGIFMSLGHLSLTILVTACWRAEMTGHIHMNFCVNVTGLASPKTPRLFPSWKVLLLDTLSSIPTWQQCFLNAGFSRWLCSFPSWLGSSLPPGGVPLGRVPLRPGQSGSLP